MGFVPASAGTSSSGEWSLGSVGGKEDNSLYRNNAFTPPNEGGGGGGGRSILGTASVVSRSAKILAPSSSSQANAPRIRPMTGLARAENNRSTLSSATIGPLPKGSRIIESAGYYQSILQNKITDIVKEIERLQYETEMADVQSKPRMALQKKHDDLLCIVQMLEGNLADYNIAREYMRSGSSPGDIKNSTLRIITNNKKKEKYIDSIFYKRKKVEGEITALEAELNRRHALVEGSKNSIGIGDNTEFMVDEYRSLVNQIEAITAEMEQQEDETVLFRHKLKMRIMESKDDAQVDRSALKTGKKHIENMKKQLNEMEEDIQVAVMTEDDAREHLIGKIDSIQLSTKDLEEESLQLEMEVATLQGQYRKLLSDKMQGGTVKAHGRLLQTHEKLKQFVDEEMPVIKAKLDGERSRLESSIETLRNDISEKERILQMELPSRDEMDLMKDEMAFTAKHLDDSQETMTLLQQQKKKRMEEVCT